MCHAAGLLQQFSPPFFAQLSLTADRSNSSTPSHLSLSPCPPFVLKNVLRKVQHQDALQISDVVMASLLRMFQSTAGSGGVQEDALMAVSTLVEGQLRSF